VHPATRTVRPRPRRPRRTDSLPHGPPVLCLLTLVFLALPG
jgi:hypothetical protein